MKQGPNQMHKGMLPFGAGAPHMHHCLIVTMNQEALLCPVGAPCGGCGQNRIEFPPLHVLLSLPEGPGTAEPVTCPESPIAKVASIGVQLKRRRRCLGNVEEAALVIPVRGKSEPPVNVCLGGRGEAQVVVEVASASAGVNQAAEEDPIGWDDFGSNTVKNKVFR